MKYAIFGAGGQVGERLCMVLPGRHLTHKECDITDHAQVDKAVKDVDWVINAAAFTNVDEAEKRGLDDPAVHVNSYGVCVLAEACKAQGIRLCHISTDQVFSGDERGEIETGAKCAPVNVYGESKLRGEMHALTDPRNIVVRTSWVFGGKQSFVTKVLEWAKDREMLAIADDLFSRPTYAKDLAIAIRCMTEAGMSGLHHVANTGWCSKAGLASAILGAAGIKKTILRAPSANFDSPAKRPKWTILKLSKIPGFTNRTWESALEAYMLDAGLAKAARRA